VNYLPGTKTATLTLSGALPAGRYLLDIRPTITDEAGNQLGGGTAVSQPAPGRHGHQPVNGDDTYYVRLNAAGRMWKSLKTRWRFRRRARDIYPHAGVTDDPHV